MWIAIGISLIAQQIRQMIDGKRPATLVNSVIWGNPKFQNKLKRFHKEMR